MVNSDPAWVTEYKSRTSKAIKSARSVRNTLRMVLGFSVGIPLFSFMLLRFMLVRDASVAEINVCLLGAIQGVFAVSWFLVLGLHRRQTRGTMLRAAAYVFGAAMIGATVSVDNFYQIIEAFDKNGSLRDFFGGGLPVELQNVYVDLAGGMVNIAGVMLVLRRRMKFFERGRTSGAILPVPSTAATALRNVLADISKDAGKVGLAIDPVSVWLDRTHNGVLPSVWTDRKGRSLSHHLLIPRGFFRFLSEQPNRARAILAHEIGHVYQKDTDLWAMTDLVFSVFQRTIVPLLAINVAYGVYMAAAEGMTMNITSSVGILAAAIFSRRSAAAARRNSEFLADYFAASIYDRNVLVDCIRDYSDNGSALHPGRKERVERLLKMPDVGPQVHALVSNPVPA